MFEFGLKGGFQLLLGFFLCPGGILGIMHALYPDQIVTKDRQTFTVPKRCVSVREPYSDERRKAASERAKAAGYRPPTPKKGSE